MSEKPDYRREQKRRRDDRPESTIDFWTIVIAMILLVMGMMLGYGWRACLPPAEPRIERSQFTQQEKRWIRQRHKYHGIYGSVIENGEHYFYRNGKKCKL